MDFALDQLGSPLRITPPMPMSVEDFWNLGFRYPDLRFEREPNGDVIVMTPTNRDTGYRGLYISRQLGAWADQDRRGYAFDSSTGFTLPDGSVRSPDAAWVRSEKWSPGSEDSYTTVLCPDFVIELRSKTDRLKEAQAKMRAWISNGVELAWLIDPERRMIEVYRQGQDKPDVADNVTSIYADEPVSGFLLETQRIWS